MSDLMSDARSDDISDEQHVPTLTTVENISTELEESKEESFNTSLDEDEPPPFKLINENVYIVEKGTSRDEKRSKRMMCTCQFDPETDNLSEACGDDCLNRLLMIECGSRCPCGEYCNNKRFTRKSYAPAEVFKTEKKGWGLKATQDITPYSFVMEYCGEVCTIEEFEMRRGEYEKDKRRHYYFMSLKTDEILDATKKGNYSRFINHSCNPNCETQKWTVNGRLCVGFFSVCHISAGDELTFDYQFQRFGESAQKCYCGSDNCRGYLGATKQSDTPTVSRSDTARERKGGAGKRRGEDADSIFEKELYDIVGGSWRLRNVDQVLSFSRLMLRAESLRQRTMLLKVLQATRDTVCLKRFLSYQGLRLLWSWMVELTDQHTTEALEARVQVLLSLECLPIPSKNLLTDNKIWQIVQKWAETKSSSQPLENERVVISEADCTTSHENDLVKENERARNIEIKNKEDSAVIDDKDIENKEDERQNEDERQSEDNNKAHGDIVKTDKEGISSQMKTENQMLSPEVVGSSSDMINDNLSEAEGREAIPVITDEESKVVNMANDLLVKWSSLKEVFRIPKKAITKTDPVPLFDNENHLKQKRSNEDDDIDNKKKKRREIRSENDQTKTIIRPPIMTPSVNIQRTGLLGSPPVGYPPPLQNTLIVQSQPGQSLYVQQQIFPSPVPHGLHIRVPHIPPGSQQVTPGTHGLNIPPGGSHGLPMPPGGSHGLNIMPPGGAHGLPMPPGGSHRLPMPPGSHGLQVIPSSQVTHGLQVTAPGCHGFNTPPSSHGLQVTPSSHGSQQVVTSGSPGVHVIPAQFVPLHFTPTSIQQPPLLQPPPIPSVTSVSSSTSSYLPSSSSSSLLKTEQTLPPPPPLEKQLPPNWKEAKEPSGKVYYYHTITRKTQWDRPTEDDKEGDILMDLATPDFDEEEEVNTGQPRTPDDSPPSSPISQAGEQRKSSTAPKDVFKHSLSKLIVRCLDHHRKPNCKYGRITCSEDFKHLARKLTFGITEKEIARRGSADALEFNDQVKSRAKSYIKNYMKKFGPIYSHS